MTDWSDQLRGMTDQRELQELLEELAADKVGHAIRVRMCETLAVALARIGQVLWIMGFVIGPGRVSGDSPFRFGDDRAVGIATVAQIGGQLGLGAIDLLKADNQYAAAALARQLVEVEYLASAFAEQHEIAADWLRADDAERRSFWSPSNMRKRANGRFLNSDYWHHCEMGGHPTTPGMALLPDHDGFPVAFLWADLAGHLHGIWKSTLQSTERVNEGPPPAEWDLPDVPGVIAEWESTDGLTAAMRDMHDILRTDPDAFSGSASED